MTETVIEAKGLVKKFGDLTAVAGIDLEVHAGEIFGFLGPNGAGKSTTISILCTLLTPSAGTAKVAGIDVVQDPARVRQRIGLVFQDPSLDDQLTGRENLEFHAWIYSVPASERKKRIDEMLALLQLTERAGSQVRTYSGGMKRRLEIARGMLHQPQILFLDEPTLGLDPQTRQSIWTHLNELRATKGITIFMTTHYMDEAEYCDRIAIIDRGTIVALGTPDELKAMVGGDVVTITSSRPDEAAAEIEKRLGVTPIRDNGSLRAIYIIWYRDILRYWRDRWRLVASLAQPLLFLIVFGSGLSSALGRGTLFGSAGGFTYIQFMYPGIIGMAILFTAIFGAMSIVWDREFGFLKEVLVAPIDRSAVAIGKALGGTTQAMIQGLILLVLAPFVGVKLSFLTIVELIPLAALLAFGLSSFGVALASTMKSLQGFQVVMNFLMMPMFFLSGALFPLTNLPGWMTWLTRLDPASYGIDPIRRVVLSNSGLPNVNSLGLTINGQVLAIPMEAAIMLAFGAVLLGIAVVMFQRRD